MGHSWQRERPVQRPERRRDRLGRDVYVADSGNHRVQRFSPSGTFIASSGTLGSANGQLNFPSGLAFGESDRLYVADTGNHRIQRFITANGGIIAVKDSVPDDPEDFTFTAGGGLIPTRSGSTTTERRIRDLQYRGFSPARGPVIRFPRFPFTGWDLTSSTCSDGSPVSNIDVSADEVVTCTFTNRRRGRIIVVQDSLPNDPQDFSFTVGGGLDALFVPAR